MVKYSQVILCEILLVTILTIACQKQPPLECHDAIACVTIKADEPVKIGVIQDLSGGAAVFGTVQLRSIQLALDHRNNQLLGHQIALQIEDEQCAVEGGKNAALKIATDPQAVAILGTTCSGAAASASKIMSDAGLVMISGINTAPSLTSIDNEKGSDWQVGYFRTSSNDALRGRTAAMFAFRELGISKAATIDDGDAYTRGATEIFAHEFTRLGGEIVMVATVDKGDIDMKPVLTSVVNSKARLLYLPLYPPEGIRIVRQTRRMPELSHVVLMGGSALLVESSIKRMGMDCVGMYFTGATQPEGAGNKDLIAAYEAKYAESPVTSYNSAYDATNILLNAMEKVAVRQKDGTLQIGRQALRDALYATTDFQGATGRLSCDRFGDCGLSKFTILSLDVPSTGSHGLNANVVYTYVPESLRR